VLSGPVLGCIEEGGTYLDIIAALEESQFTVLGPTGVLVGAAQGARDDTVPVPDEEVGIAIPEEEAALRIGRLLALSEKWRHPEWIAAIDLPREAQEAALLTAVLHLSDFDHVDSPLAAFRRNSN
jgi:hypothetical protein